MEIRSEKECIVTPLGRGLDDTDQILTAISQCGIGGKITFTEGNFNITRKMNWELRCAKVDLFGFLNFVPDVEFWLNKSNTYQVVFIQSQSSWFVVTGNDFEINAHNTGGIQGNGQVWWNYFTNHTRAGGDGRPIALTVFNATRGVVKNFLIESQPFWCNTVAESKDIVYDGMKCNATNTNAEFAGMKHSSSIVPNTDGIDTYRSDNIKLLNWDITNGDDCLVSLRNFSNPNSSNLFIKNVTCRGGNGITFGSLGQYFNLSDNVENVFMEDLTMVRLPSSVQPNMITGVYFKTFTGEIVGTPPVNGGGGTGLVQNVTVRNVHVDQVEFPVQLYQINGGNSSQTPSTLTFRGLHFKNWRGNVTGDTLVDLLCSPAVNCTDITFDNFNISTANNSMPQYFCQNVTSITGLDGSFNTYILNPV
ncbi:glycoside hydrolase family 28 protein [Collybiopsis luxurians FD-317 M1]|uniref:galacturonan 1,4-alpha-galacturonidase n=1 Tax=Collybiopsis luxurians FD-317 M1 TaxID=944289 RepID=A0A0D0BNZ8_9AGAR|nr:glycoside hydrolase family 28 protein [Collybiopsis luxurians FD-317 M1]